MDHGKGHSVEIRDKKWLKVTGVKHVDSYDDKEIFLETSLGNMVIKGSGFNISSLNLEDGSLNVDGQVESLLYTEALANRRKNFVKRLLK
ncbi:MAG: sporulation protein YabP [Bacillota bacterium]